MKKSIKYAGIAAATLLTVAPIAAPVVSTVQAASVVKTATDASELKKAISDFNDNFGDIDESNVVTSGDNAFVLSNASNSDNNKMTLDTFQAKELATLGVTSLLTVNPILTASDADNDANIRDFYVTATANGSEVKNVTDLQTYLNDSDYSVVYTVHYTYNDTNAVAQKGSVDIKVKGDDTVKLTSVNASYTTPLDVALDSSVTATQLIGAGTVKVTDQNGDGIVTKSAKPSTNFYNTYAGAMNGTQSALADATTGTKSTAVQADVDAGLANAVGDTFYATTDDEGDAATFDKAGTYYQPITITATAGSPLGQFIVKKYNDNPTKYTVKVNGKTATPGYDFSSNAEDVAADATNATDLSMTFVRTVKVADSSAVWTTENVDGQVTTKNDAAYYTLKNNDNNTITNRALQANTAWKTDKVRTDQNGNKQYRVATGEWVNADDVTFTKAGDVDTSTGALTDIQKVTGTVSLDGGNYVYFLYGKDGKVLTQRSLMPGTDWKVINTAKDAEGNTYYRVATNEWLQQGTGVHFN